MRWFLLGFLVACGSSHGGDDDDVRPDGGHDGVAPQLVTQAPANGAGAWLHGPLVFTFDEAIEITGATATVTLAGAPVAATVAKQGERDAVVQLPAATRGLGSLTIELTGVTDLAGNAATAIATQYTVSAWDAPVLERGAATGSPAIVIGDDGSVIAAWTVGTPARVVVSRNAGTWQPLGDALGAAASSPAIALVDGTPVVAWIDDGATRIARWDGTTWLDLPSLGAGTAIALSGNAAVVIAGTATVSRLAGAVWEPAGTIALAGSVVGEPAIAATTAEVAVAWIAGSAVHAARCTTTCTAMASIAAPGATRASVALRDQTVAVAWDQRDGSSGVYAARSTTTTWTRLGRALDIDVAGDAVAPAIALDDAATPIVAWSEKIETAERGVIARWSGSTWELVGGRNWLVGPAKPSHVSLAVHTGGAPVVGYGVPGSVAVARFNGPAVAADGIAARTSIAGCALAPSAPPARLLQTGCFTLPGAGNPPVPHAGLVPYDIVVELWSDGAKKRRWIGLPDGASMTTSATGAWAAPTGTIIVKEFAVETTPGNTATRRPVETRFLVNTATGWQGFTYQWRSDGSDADLLNDGTFTATWPLDDGGTYTHYYPSRSACLSCHESSYGPLLGLRPQQLARFVDYDGVIADQLATLASIGVGPASTAAPFLSPHDGSATVEERVRGYMAANCAHCHNPDHIAIKDLRYPTPLAQTRLCEAIVPGAPPNSRLYQLVSQRPGMPALGTLIPDPFFVDLVDRWITGMTSCP
ncbi:MAG: hypothetical protein ABI867_28185 [Kofleriaceae bacterium]